MNQLTLQFLNRSGKTTSDESAKTDRRYIDFVVSGQSLAELFEVSSRDLIGTFGWTENIEYENNQIDEFSGTLQPELKTERTSFYVCPECGDIGCGAITAKIEVKDNMITWKDFAYENDTDEPDLTDYKEIGPFNFNKHEYLKTLEEIRRHTK